MWHLSGKNIKRAACECDCGWLCLWIRAVTVLFPSGLLSFLSPALYSRPPSRSTEVNDFICATQANIQSPRAPDLWSVKHLAVLILSPSEQLCIQRPATPLPPGNNGLSAWLAKWGVKWNGTWFVFHIFGVTGSCVCLMNLSLSGQCHNCLEGWGSGGWFQMLSVWLN